MHEDNTFSERHNLLINREAQEVKRGRVKSIFWIRLLFLLTVTLSYATYGKSEMQRWFQSQVKWFAFWSNISKTNHTYKRQHKAWFPDTGDRYAWKIWVTSVVECRDSWLGFICLSTILCLPAPSGDANNWSIDVLKIRLTH